MLLGLSLMVNNYCETHHIYAEKKKHKIFKKALKSRRFLKKIYGGI